MPQLQMGGNPPHLNADENVISQFVHIFFGLSLRLLSKPEARIRTLKLSYYGHIMIQANCLEKDIIQGCVPGSRGRGQPRRRWKEDVSDWTGLRINDAARSAKDRDSWRRVIRAANPSTGGRQLTTTMISECNTLHLIIHPHTFWLAHAQNYTRADGHNYQQ